MICTICTHPRERHPSSSAHHCCMLRPSICPPSRLAALDLPALGVRNTIPLRPWLVCPTLSLCHTRKSASAAWKSRPTRCKTGHGTSCSIHQDKDGCNNIPNRPSTSPDPYRRPFLVNHRGDVGAAPRRSAITSIPPSMIDEVIALVHTNQQ